MDDLEAYFGVHQLLQEEGLLPPPNPTDVDTRNALLRRENANLSNEQRKMLCLKPIEMKQDGKLPRGSITKLSIQFGVHKSTVSRIFNEMEKQASQAVTEKHAIERLKWIVSHIEDVTVDRQPTFKDMSNTIHIDEKWFYLNLDKRRFYLLSSEVNPYIVCISKRYKIKAMFMAVQGKPLHDDNGVMVHDGKYDIQPFVFKQRAKKRSKNREAGTIETKAIQNVTKDVSRDMLLKIVIPSIIEKWPQRMSKDIYIQQDNAIPHLQSNDPHFIEASTRNGFNTTLINQPPQSLDFNVFDLAIFRAIQSLQYQSFPENLDDLIKKVGEAYQSYDPNLIRYTWIQLQHVMLASMRVKGGNNYKMPHVGKARLDRLGILQKQLQIDKAELGEAECSDVEPPTVYGEEDMSVDVD